MLTIISTPPTFETDVEAATGDTAPAPSTNDNAAANRSISGQFLKRRILLEKEKTNAG
jgi:hypothetical protein